MGKTNNDIGARRGPAIKQSVEDCVWNDQGEMVAKRVNRTLSWGQEPQFIKLYLQDVLYLSDLPKHHENILWELLQRVTYAGEGMEIALNASVKRKIMERLGLQNIRSINNALTDLVKGKILYRVDAGLYRPNPYLFGKGDWQDIARLRLEISYDDIEGRTFATTQEYKPKAEIKQIPGQLEMQPDGGYKEAAV